MENSAPHILYLMDRCNVSREVAMVALSHNRGNVFRAQDALQNTITLAQYMREAREYELGK